MLSPADLAVCERDPALPGLPEILDASSLADILGLRPLTSTYLRYKPGVSCTAAFLHPEAGALAAYAYPRNRYAEVRNRLEWVSDPSVVFLDKHCVVVAPARLDRELRALRRFLDPDRRKKYLRRVIGRSERFCESDTHLLRYKPGRRLVARIDLKGVPQAVLKITGVDDFNRALIGATGAAAHGGAPLLGASTQLRALITRWVDGVALCPDALGHRPEGTAVAEAGAALARLHADAFRPAASILPADDALSLDAIAEDLVPLDPGLAGRTRTISAEIAARLADMDYTPTLVHGDFSADQVVMTAERPVIIDWDQSAYGDPARDLGGFLARLDAQAADGILTQAQAGDLGAALVKGYGRAAGSVPEGLALHHARALLMLAPEGFRMRREDWLERGHTLVDGAVALLARPTRGPRDPAMPELDRALEIAGVLPEIARALGTATPDLRLAPPELIRHKPGRRALIRYHVEGATPHVLLGKMRAKGPDRRTPDVHNALRQAGLDGSDDHGVGVPRAVGRIDRLNMWMQEEVRGAPLAQSLDPDTAHDAVSFARTGAALARLHDLPAVVDRRWTLDDEARVLDGALERAVGTMPDTGEALRAIQRGARAQLEALGEATSCGIHRDFYFDQVLVDGPRIWLVDLDLYSVGDPAIDIGNFLAHLDEFALRRFGQIGTFEAEVAAFLDGYRTVRPLPAAHRIAVLRSVSLARHIHISMGFETRRHITQGLISVSIRALGNARRRAS